MLFAVDLDGDEVLVQQRRDLGIVEGLVAHHVAPVAGRVADGKHHRYVAQPGLFEGFVPIGEPVD